MVFGLISCNSNDNATSGMTSLQVKLTDAPALYDAINLNVQGVAIVMDNETQEQVIKFDHAGMYNILDFNPVNGKTLLLADKDIPAGIISQIRLILGEEGNTLVKDGKTYALTTPSASKSGLKLNLLKELLAGMLYNFTLDFDAAHSIVYTGNGKYILKPVIRLLTDAQGGKIEGYVKPIEAKAFVESTIGDKVATAIPTTDGKYTLAGLEPGNWNVRFVPDTTTN